MQIVRKTIEKDEKYLRQISMHVDMKDINLTEEIKLLEKFCLENE